jgi:hypothetical protein
MTAVTAMHAAPDWSTIIDREIACPLCGYNLRGLLEPRCPECGYTFDWEPLIHPPPAHRFLFEHHPEHNVRSFFHTWLMGLRPGRFWRDVQPTDVPRPGRLIVHWIAATSLVLLLPLAAIANIVFVRVSYIDLSPEFWWAVLQRCITSADIWIAEVIFFWPIMTYGGLRIFRQSFARARLKPEHALRCALYSTDASFWVALVLVIMVGPLRQLVPWEWRYIFGYGGYGVTAALVLSAYTSYRMRCACRYYLRMDHALGMALVTQLIPFLLVLTIVLASGAN